MLNRFDDYPIHQTADPIAYLNTSDRNAYGRYWFNGCDPAGEFYFGAAFGVYPNREIMDCALSIVRKDGTQHAFRASKHLRGDRTDLTVGPMSLEVLDPMRSVRIRIDKNRTGVLADVTFRARTPAVPEPLDLQREGARVVMQVTRFSQFGMWEGSISFGEDRLDLDPDTVQGVRDRSWGFRKNGEPESGAPRVPRQVFWLWAPITWNDRCTHYGLRERQNGERWKQFAHVFPRHPPGACFDPLSSEGVHHAEAGEHRLEFESGTRFVRSGEIEMLGSKRQTVKVEGLLRFHMMGIGYQHPNWGHGMYLGEETFMSEAWNTAELDTRAIHNQHVQTVVRASCAGEIGHGVIEQGFIGPYDRYAFKGLVDA